MALTRTDHLQWCKDRALEYLNRGDVANAFASFASDFEKHEDCKMPPILMQLGMMHMMQSDAVGTRRWIEGFN